jgi:hypothetical protein
VYAPLPLLGKLLSLLFLVLFSLSSSILKFVVMEALCLVLAEEVVVLLAVLVGLSWTTGFVLFSVRLAVFVDVFFLDWGMVRVGAEV